MSGKRFLLSLFILILSPLMLLAAPLQVCLVSGSEEYDSDTSLTKYREYLENNFDVQCTLIKAVGFEELPGTEALKDCDVALFYTRRLRIDGEALQNVKDYCLSGKPIVAIRTASHGFQNWLEFDRIVLGGNYRGHYGNDITQEVKILPEAGDHPVLEGVSAPIRSRYSLYQTPPVADDVTVLMTGTIPGLQKPEPVTWTRIHNGGRVFYTSLGGLEDFENETFKRLIANALHWTANRNMQMKPQPEPQRRSKPTGMLKLPLRAKVQTSQGSEEWKDSMETREIPIANTAIIICDMWDRHWCRGATERCDAIARKMAPFIDECRDAGIQIIHAPSDTLTFYAGLPQRKRMQNAARVTLPEPKVIQAPDLPIDDSDGGCDTDDPTYWAWTRQHPAISIGEFDGISDNGDEIFNFLEQEGIDTLLIMGVHTNMCIMNRSFAICRMTRLGKNCVLVRDFTDTMYDPKDPPYVTHDEGTRLVIEHIEKYWCPTVTSAEVLAGITQ